MRKGNRAYICCFLLLLAVMLLTGCTRQKPTYNSGLLTAPTERWQAWNVPDNLVVSGAGNSFRVVTGSGLLADAALELAAGGAGHMEYFQIQPSGPDVLMQFRLQFLSTQGTGRIKITALDANGTLLGSVGWVYTGSLPDRQQSQVWIDARYGDNYSGGWLEGKYNLAKIFRDFLPGQDIKEATVYRCSIETGEGQHALITGLTLETDWNQAVTLTPQQDLATLIMGDSIACEVDIENKTGRLLPTLTVDLLQPYGYGLLTLDSPRRMVENLAPGEKRRLLWQVKAQRPDAVNLGKPWELHFAINELPVAGFSRIAVTDPRPGRVYYVMTDDLEPIDSAGYQRAWGNGDGWLEPQELKVQLIRKAERLNEIAGQFGVKWTHYIAWPVIRAAEWAAEQDKSGDWAATAVAVRQSMKSQTELGHEYAIHLHMDYDPFLPGNVLSYNPQLNGLWANHLRHGWSHSLGEEGEFDNYATRTGTLYSYQRIIEEETVTSAQGQLLTTRAGSFDFGNDKRSQAMSVAAYRKVGLWGTSDADGNIGGITAAPFGKEIYFSRVDDINLPAQDLHSLGLVEFRPTPQQYLSFDSQSTAVMNDLVDQGIGVYAKQGLIKPGIHGIIGFTHAMFVMGADDWQSLQGGQFEAIEGHLKYVKERYADQGLLSFATASELVKEYLDYYAPEPVAIYGARLSQNMLYAEYDIRLLGRDIPIDSLHPHTVNIKYPLYLRDSAYRISILKDGQTIYTTWGLPTPHNDIAFIIDDYKAQYTLKVYENVLISKIINKYRGLKARIFKLLKK